MALGDFFSSELRKQFSSRSIKIGSVIKCFVKNTIPPKEKRFIVLGVSPNNELVGLVFINTNINFNIINNPILQNCQYYLKKENNAFIDYDCYVDCSDLISYNYKEISDAITENPSSVLGEVDPSVLTKMIDLVKSSPKITPKLLKKFSI